MKIGIICPMEVEMEKLASVFDAKEYKKGIFKASLSSGSELYIALSGIGKVNAAASTQRLIDLTGSDLIINSGVAGGLNPNLGIGEIVISADSVYHDFNPLSLLDEYSPFGKIFKADKELIALAEKACIENGIKYKVGTVATGDRFVADNDDKNRIINDFGADCVEMEGAAVSHVCVLNGVRFIIIRSLSDFADDTAETHNDNEKPAADNAATITEYIIKNLI